MTPVFIDTSYLLALELANDQHHSAALEHWKQVVKSPLQLVTTSYVFDEIVTFFNCRGYHTKAIETGNRLLHSPSVNMIHIDEALFYGGWFHFQQNQDKDYSLTDCISFIVMRRQNIQTAYTFDRHFVQAQFHSEP
ncbi:Nucleic acid-binding protein [Nitrosomonas nitrosa]|uniref:Nucleic acid-binding protein n=1 Tax=Nitrosomonas nitrosa TaxID=52442 RepID=A0A8H9D950_9PROT|nr:PIN domain-containing protein [Nitrosomonas nitrosa]CAE6506480.1 Nucleic acid-binding protein [Nitrosomonas nitrosa]